MGFLEDVVSPVEADPAFSAGHPRRGGPDAWSATATRMPGTPPAVEPSDSPGCGPDHFVASSRADAVSRFHFAVSSANRRMISTSLSSVRSIALNNLQLWPLESLGRFEQPGQSAIIVRTGSLFGLTREVPDLTLIFGHGSVQPFEADIEFQFAIALG